MERRRSLRLHSMGKLHATEGSKVSPMSRVTFLGWTECQGSLSRTRNVSADRVNLPSTASEAASAATDTAASASGRKKWIPRTPLEVMLEQIQKAERRVAEMREELAKEERELSKLQQAKKVLESL